MLCLLNWEDDWSQVIRVETLRQVCRCSMENEFTEHDQTRVYCMEILLMCQNKKLQVAIMQISP